MGDTPDGISILRVLRSSYDTLQDQKYKDAFLLIAGMWPASSQMPRYFWRGCLQNAPTLAYYLAGILYPEKGVEEGHATATIMLIELANRSLLGLVEIESVPYVEVHDLLVDVAVLVVRESNRFCRWVKMGQPLKEASSDSEWEHVGVSGSPPFILPSSFLQSQRLLSLAVDCCDLQFSESRFSFQNRSMGVNRCRLLSLRGCTVRTLPESIGQLTSLTALDLTFCNRLRKLPKSIGRLRNLTELHLQATTLQTLPSSIGELSRLTSISFNCCVMLQSLPESFGLLTGLETLEFAHCDNLRSLPKSFGQLTGLQYLHLKSFVLRTLPPSVGNLNKLMGLSLERCYALQSLPVSMGQLTSLMALDLSGCQKLQNLPEGLRHLPALTYLNLHDCPAKWQENQVSSQANSEFSRSTGRNFGSW